MTRKWGGRRPGAGHPFRRRLKLSDEGGRNLAQLTRAWRAERNKPALREEDVVEELVRDALQRMAPVPPAI